MAQLYGYPFWQFEQGQIEPLPARFEKPEPVHRFYGQNFLKPGNVNRATALLYNLYTKHHFMFLVSAFRVWWRW